MSIAESTLDELLTAWSNADDPRTVPEFPDALTDAGRHGLAALVRHGPGGCADPWSAQCFRGVPTFFRALCGAASTGGSGGYRDVGASFASHLLGMLEAEDALDRDVKEAVLRAALFAARPNPRCPPPPFDAHPDDPDRHVLAWLDGEFPRCMDLVPRRRRAAFLQGLLAATEDGL